MSTVHCYYS